MRAEPRHPAVRWLGVTLSAAVAGAALLPAGRADAALTAAAWKPADNGATIAAVQWIDAARTTFDFTVRSKALGIQAKVRVLVPKGWGLAAQRTWPTVYALHGGRDNYTSWTRSSEIEQLARRWRVLVVMPEGANGSYTNWYNDGKFGAPRWENFHNLEVRQLVERNFKAGFARATMGLSSGAQGACTYPGRFPGVFLYAACFSGVLSMRSPGMPALLMYTAGGSVKRPERIWGDPMIPSHLKNWDLHDPIQLLPRAKSTQFYISAGTTGRPGPFDPPNLPPWHAGRVSEPPIGATNQQFLARARELGIKINAHIYADGTHSWPYWRREMNTAWPLMMKALRAVRA